MAITFTVATMGITATDMDMDTLDCTSASSYQLVHRMAQTGQAINNRVVNGRCLLHKSDQFLPILGLVDSGSGVNRPTPLGTC